MNRCADLAIGALGLTLSTWVLSPLSGIRFYPALLVAFLLLGTCAVATSAGARSLFARRELIPFYVFGVIHAISFLVLLSELALEFDPHRLQPGFIQALVIAIGRVLAFESKTRATLDYGTIWQFGSVGASGVAFLVSLVVIRQASIYDALIRNVVSWSAALVLLLLATHLAGARLPYLTPTLTETDFIEAGFSRNNQLAFYLSLVFPFAWTRLVHCPTWRGAIASMLIAFGILYTFSRMGVVACVVAMIVPCLTSMGRVKRFRVAAGAVSLVVLLVAISGVLTPARYLELRIQGRASTLPVDKAASLVEAGEQWFDWNLSRAKYIRWALEGFAERPWFGHGFKAFFASHTEYDNDGSVIRQPYTHNDYAQILYELGLAGFGAFLAMFGVAIYKTWQARRADDAIDNALVDGQLAALVVLALMLNMINAYETLVFWILMAGSVVLGRDALAGRVRPHSATTDE